MSEHLHELLSSYLDDEVTTLERLRVEGHLAQCAECRADLEALRALVRRAGALDDRPPEQDLWAGIAERIGSADTSDVVPLAARRRHLVVSWVQLAAAASILIALSAGTATLLARRAAVQSGSGARTGTAATNVMLARNAPPEAQIMAGYDAPIRELQSALTARRGRLDTATVRVIEQSLRVIDAAIRQAQDALARDPNNPYLNGHLQRALDRKLDLLRQAATLPVVS